MLILCWFQIFFNDSEKVHPKKCYGQKIAFLYFWAYLFGGLLLQKSCRHIWKQRKLIDFFIANLTYLMKMGFNFLILLEPIFQHLEDKNKVTIDLCNLKIKTQCVRSYMYMPFRWESTLQQHCKVIAYTVYTQTRHTVYKVYVHIYCKGTDPSCSFPFSTLCIVQYSLASATSKMQAEPLVDYCIDRQWNITPVQVSLWKWRHRYIFCLSQSIL